MLEKCCPVYDKDEAEELSLGFCNMGITDKSNSDWSSKSNCTEAMNKLDMKERED